MSQVSHNGGTAPLDPCSQWRGQKSTFRNGKGKVFFNSAKKESVKLLVQAPKERLTYLLPFLVLLGWISQAETAHTTHNLYFGQCSLRFTRSEMRTCASRSPCYRRSLNFVIIQELRCSSCYGH